MPVAFMSPVDCLLVLCWKTTVEVSAWISTSMATQWSLYVTNFNTVVQLYVWIGQMSYWNIYFFLFSPPLWFSFVLLTQIYANSPLSGADLNSWHHHTRYHSFFFFFVPLMLFQKSMSYRKSYICTTANVSCQTWPHLKGQMLNRGGWTYV